jgi:diaminohydroxyphosphoribosylaminopyrimidine deaminase/5-amino-6-(5-phosphoribosylamino)uracil reductase
MTAVGDDATFMQRALALAARGRGLTSPNPLVGAVLVRDGRVIGEGYHRRAGGPHAEIEALRAATESPEGATLYVTLEPCAHHGRTPPCAPALVAARLARVVVAVEDPNPLVGGRGLAILQAAGVTVTTGVLAEEASRENRAFLTAMRASRPHVTLKGAVTLDGKIADRHGTSRWITGEAARRHAHVLRRASDAIVVGIGTALHDDPALTVRLGEPWPREPYRVVLDSAARLPPGAALIRSGDPGRVIVATGDQAPADRVGALVRAGVSILTCPDGRGRVDVRALLAGLLERGVIAVLVEGGGEVHASFAGAGVVDRVAVYVAPILLGGREAPGLLGGAGHLLPDALRLGPLAVTPLEPDLLIEADVVGVEPVAAGAGAMSATGGAPALPPARS